MTDAEIVTFWSVFKSVAFWTLWCVQVFFFLFFLRTCRSFFPTEAAINFLNISPEHLRELLIWNIDWGPYTDITQCLKVAKHVKADRIWYVVQVAKMTQPVYSNLIFVCFWISSIPTQVSPEYVTVTDHQRSDLSWLKSHFQYIDLFF